MSRLRVVPIVEGQGDCEAIRVLLERVWREIVGGEFIDVVDPIRGKRGQLVQENGMCIALNYADLKLRNEFPQQLPGMVLILLDCDEDLGCQLAPQLLALARSSHAHLDVGCVLPVVNYESWFVAAAESLAEFVKADNVPRDPELARQGKNWIRKHFLGKRKYKEKIDQPKLTARFDLQLCRSRSPSFDKLCRELEKRKTNSQPSS